MRRVQLHCGLGGGPRRRGARAGRPERRGGGLLACTLNGAGRARGGGRGGRVARTGQRERADGTARGRERVAGAGLRQPRRLLPAARSRKGAGRSREPGRTSGPSVARTERGRGGEGRRTECKRRERQSARARSTSTREHATATALGEQEPGEREWLVVGMCPAGGAGVRQINWTLIIGDINEVQDYCQES